MEYGGFKNTDKQQAHGASTDVPASGKCPEGTSPCAETLFAICKSQLNYSFAPKKNIGKINKKIILSTEDTVPQNAKFCGELIRVKNDIFLK